MAGEGEVRAWERSASLGLPPFATIPPARLWWACAEMGTDYPMLPAHPPSSLHFYQYLTLSKDVLCCSVYSRGMLSQFNTNSHYMDIGCYLFIYTSQFIYLFTYQSICISHYTHIHIFFILFISIFFSFKLLIFHFILSSSCFTHKYTPLPIHHTHKKIYPLRSFNFVCSIIISCSRINSHHGEFPRQVKRGVCRAVGRRQTVHQRDYGVEGQERRQPNLIVADKGRGWSVVNSACECIYDAGVSRT